MRMLCSSLLVAAVSVLGLTLPPAARAAGSWSSAGRMSGARAFNTATLLKDGRVLVAGGRIGNTTVASAEVYDPSTNAWSSAGRMVEPREFHTASLLDNGKVLVAGGTNGQTLASAEVYDPATNRWTSVGAMTTDRHSHVAATLPDGRVLIATGYSMSVPGEREIASAERFNPATGTWSSAGALTTRRTYATATALPDGRVLVVGGLIFSASPQQQAGAELYDPMTNTWSGAGSLAGGRNGHTATLIPGGNVLVAGGSGGAGRANAERWDPATRQWSPAGRLASERIDAEAVLLPNGKVFITGGWNSDVTGGLATAELYETGANEWADAPNPQIGRASPSATLLRTGRVLVSGGGSADAELYAPPTALSVAPSAALGEHTTGAAGAGSVVVTNTGELPLFVGGASIDGPDPSDFAIADDNCRQRAVAVGASCSFTVRFVPSAVGPRSAELTLDANTSAERHRVALAGTGVAPEQSPPGLGPSSPSATAASTRLPQPTLDRIVVTLAYSYSANRKRTRVSRLVVKDVPAGATVRARCPSGCARTRYVKHDARGNVPLKPLIKKPLKAGTVITVTVEKQDFVAAVKTFKARRGKSPTVRTSCLPPESSKPEVCG